MAVLLACRTPAPERPNIILITLDTFRADSLAGYGGSPSLTPHLNDFASQSVVFRNAVTPIGTTFPAHASLFTGLYPRRHGVRWNGDALDDSFTTIAERARAAGYDTAAFVALPSMLDRGGMGQGFDLRNRGLESFSGHVIDGAAVSRAARKWLAGAHSRSFFLWLHYYETHSPYPATPYVRTHLDAMGYDGPLAEGASTELFYSMGRDVPWTDANRRALHILYDGGASRLDAEVGDVLNELRDSGILDDSVVILTADHGQALGELDQVGHGFLLSQPVIQIPLMIHMPARQAGSSSPVTTRVGLVDLYPTLLQLLSLAPGNQAVDGRSIIPALRGNELKPVPYFAECRALADNKRWSEQDAEAVAVFLGTAKATRRGDSIRFVELNGDPLQVPDGTVQPSPSEQQSLRRSIRSFLASPEHSVAPHALDVGAKRELKALGYLE